MQSGDFRSEQNDEAFDVVCENMEHVVREMATESGEEEGFPTFSEMVEFLVDSNFVSRKQVRSLQKQCETPQLTTTLSSPPATLNQSKRSESPEAQKKTKSNSFSTVGSPSKPIEQEFPESEE